MLLVADENIPVGLVAALRQAGHEIRYIREIARGASDPRVLEMALAEDAILLTSDLDFGALVWRQGLSHAGVLQLRLEQLTTREQAELVLHVLNENGERLMGAFAVLSPTSLRLRKGPLPSP